jgi:peptide/nickel transport system substrate-binding protein
MNNRFGFKDFAVLALLVLLAVSAWLIMVQRDRVQEMVAESQVRLANLERQLTRIEKTVEDAAARPIVLPAPANPGASPGTAAAAPGTPPPATTPGRDESWAKAGGAPIAWQPPWSFATDPTKSKTFAPGGSFTEIFEAQPAKLTPYIQTDVYGRRVLDQVVEPLAAYDPKTLKLRGVLAEAWQMDPAGLWLRVKIRDRARFSDGSPVTAEDMRYAFHDYVMNPQIEAQRTRSTVTDKIAKVEVISERVVEFTFKEAMFDNLDSALTLWPLPKAFYGALTPAEINKGTGLLVGSGPYKLAVVSADNQWRPGETIELVRNEQYWGDKPPLDRLRFKAINDELARFTEYRNDAADMITPAATQFDTRTADPNWAKDNQSLNWINMKSGNSFIAWNCGQRNGKPTPFTDRRVRMAMTLLLDRERMIRDIWKKIGVVSKGPFNPTSPASDPALSPHPVNVEKAKALLKEAGWEDRDGSGVLTDKDGRPFTFEFVSFGGGEIAERIALFLVDTYKAVGIRAIPKTVDWSVGDNIRKQRDFDAILMGWGANAPESDPKQIYHSNSMKDQGDNFAQWSNPEADRLIDLGRKELDFDKRMAIWRQFERVMHEDQPYTWIRVQPFLRFVKGDVSNVNTYPKGLEYWEFYRGGAASPRPN